MKNLTKDAAWHSRKGLWGREDDIREYRFSKYPLYQVVAVSARTWRSHRREAGRQVRLAWERFKQAVLEVEQNPLNR